MDVDKSEDARLFWQDIGVLGRIWYLRKIRRPQHYSANEWPQIPRDIRVLLGKQMNDRHSKTRGRYSQNYVAPNTVIGLNRWGPLINETLTEMWNDIESYDSFEQFLRAVVARAKSKATNKIVQTDNVLMAATRMIVGANYRNRKKSDITKSNTFSAILAGLLLGAGGIMTYGKIKDKLQERGLSPQAIDAGMAATIGTTLALGGAKMIFNKRNINKHIIDYRMDTFTTKLFDLNDDVILRDSTQGKIISIQGQYADVRKSDGEIRRCNLSHIYKKDDILFANPLAAWDDLKQTIKIAILKAANLDVNLQSRDWQTFSVVHKHIIKTAAKKLDDDDEIELK